MHARPKPLKERVAQLRRLRAEAAAHDPGFERRENALVLPTSFSSALEMRLAGLKAVGYRQEARGMLLLTNNRSMDDEDSLELTIREESTAAALPVITVGTIDRIVEPDYRRRCAERLAVTALGLLAVRADRPHSQVAAGACNIDRGCAGEFLRLT